MDAFEQIVETIFRRNGFWTQTSYKINLTKEEKVAIGTYSMPRPEIDILAYNPVANELLWIECKSYLNSPGVDFKSFLPNGTLSGRYKVFTNANYREIISQRLLQQVVTNGLVLPNPSLHLCLVAGKIKPKGREALQSHFETQGWRLFDEKWVKAKLLEMAQQEYENDVVMMVAKLIAKG